MSKYIYISLGLLIFIGIGFAVYVYSQKTTPPITPSSPVQELSPTPTPNELIYEDEAGFTFNYPEGVIITPIELDDNKIYSSLELTSSQSSGKTTIRISDTTLKNYSSPGSETTEISLSGLDATQFELSDKQVVAMIENKILFLIEAPKNDFWTPIYNKIIDSFILTSLSASKNSPVPVQNTDTGIIDEGEEII